MKPIEGRRPVHKETDIDPPNQKEEGNAINGQENEEKTTEEIEVKNTIKKNKLNVNVGKKEAKNVSKISKGKSTSNSSHARDIKEKLVLNRNWIILPLAILFCAIAIRSIAFYLFSEVDEEIAISKYSETTDESKLSDELEPLEYTYSNQDLSTWISLASGIKSVLREKPNKPSVFLMLYDTDSAGKTAKCIAVDVSKKAIKYLIRRAGSPVIINPNELGDQRYLQDPGLVLTEYNHTIRERGALIVPNLQEVPPKVAEIFHFICDRYTPLVETVVVFFTLKVEKTPKTAKLQDVATQTLKKLWSESMMDTTLQPLITRMTLNIININIDSANC